MVAINVEMETRERFKIVKMQKCAEEKKPYTDDKFINILLDKYEGKKK